MRSLLAENPIGVDQVIRSDFGPTWDDFIANWCLGTTPSLSEEETWSALEVFERLWPEYVDEVVQIQKNAKGMSTISPLLEAGRILSVCEGLSGFDQVLQHIKEDRVSGRPTLSELTVASEFLKIGYRPVLEPMLNGKRLDSLIKVDNQPVYVEVISPRRSKDVKQVKSDMEDLAKLLSKDNPNANIEVLFHSAIDRGTFDAIRDFIRSIPFTTVIQEYSNLAWVVKEELKQNPDDGVFIFGSDGVYKIPQSLLTKPIGAVCIYNGSEQQAAAVVRVWSPTFDTRAKRLIEGESEHFTSTELNLLVVNVSDIPNGIDSWTPLIKRRFQPKINTHLGAVAIYDEALVNYTVRRRWRVLRNPHAKKPIPEGFLKRIESLNELYNLK